MKNMPVTSHLNDLRAAKRELDEARAEFDKVADLPWKDRDEAWQKVLLAEVQYEGIYGR